MFLKPIFLAYKQKVCFLYTVVIISLFRNVYLEPLAHYKGSVRGVSG